jgi:phosphoglycerate dehydrogenase-like enzyme
MNDHQINVIVAIDYADEIIERLRDVSPRLTIERHFPEVPDRVWEQTEIACTLGVDLPPPEKAPNLKWIQLNSAGMEHVKDAPLVTEGGVKVTSVSGIHATPLAEYTIGMMLAWEFKLPTMIRDQDAVRWRDQRYTFYAPRHLRGQTIGIVGYGAIGREIARLAHAMGMTVLAMKRDVMNPADSDTTYRDKDTGDPDGSIPERLYPPEALATMARDCDYLVLLTPLTDATYHMVNKDVLAAMRETAVLINVARGQVMDEAALITALKKQKIAGAILDVFETEPLPADSPLWGMENVIISPHVAGNSHRYHERAAAVFAENLQRYIERRDLLNQLDTTRGY